MRTVAADCSQLIHSGARQIMDGLRAAAGAGLDVDDLTEVLRVASSEDNRIHAALSGAIGALDAAAEQAPEGELTVGLSCATWLSHTLQISSSAAHAQVHLARRLPSLPATAQAFERGELSPQHVSVVVRGVDSVPLGPDDVCQAN